MATNTVTRHKDKLRLNDEKIVNDPRIPLLQSKASAIYFEETESQKLSIDDVAETLGCGLFQYLLNFVCALCVADTGIIVQSIGFIIVAACDLDITRANKVWLSLAFLVGAGIGSFIWGRMADSIGRRKILLITLSFNFVLMFTAAFSYNYIMLVIITLFSGFAFGGLMPVIFPYVIEFFPRKYRAMASTITSSSGLIGFLYTSMVAYLILPQEFTLPLGSIYFTSWRAFLLICSIPLLLTIILLWLLPKSPRYLLNKGEVEKTLAVMYRIHGINQRYNKKNYQSFSLELSDLNHAKEDYGNTTFDQNLSSPKDTGHFAKFLTSPWNMRLVLTCIMWVTFLFAKFTLWFWLPAFFSHYEDGRTCFDPSSNNTLSFNSSVCLHVAKQGIIYRNTLLTTVASIPLSALTIIVIDVVGRKWLFCVLMCLSGICVFFIWFIKSAVGALAFACCYTGLLLSAWNPLDIWTSELFPTYLRSTAYGVINFTGRFGSIVGTIIFAELVDINCAVPILSVAIACFISSITSLFLPDTSNAEIY